MDDDNLVNVAVTAVQNTALNSSTGDYSPDDNELDEAAAVAEATCDTLADGMVARLLRPCVDRLDASVQCTRLSQLDLKLQLDSLAAELKRLSLIQHDYLFSATSVSSLQNSTIDDKTISSIVPTATKTTSGDTSVLLDGYARRLCDARAKIAVVGNILESTQERLRALSHRIGREHNNRRSLLEPQATVPSTTENVINEEEIKQQLHNEEDKTQVQLTDDDITVLQATLETQKLS